MSVLHIYHGGSFVWTPNLVYCEGTLDVKENIDPDYLSVDDIKDIVFGLGYEERRVNVVYLKNPNTPFGKDALLPIVSDFEVLEVIDLCNKMSFVELYVEHNDVDNWIDINSGLDDTQDQLSDHEFDDLGDDNEYVVSDESDEENVMFKEKMKKFREDKSLSNNTKFDSDDGRPNNTKFDSDDEKYYDSDDVNSASDSESEEENGNRRRKKKVRGMRYNPTTEGDDPKFVVGHQFTDKLSLIKAVKHYSIIKGYDIMTAKSDKTRLQVKCLGKNCEWKLWGSPIQNQKTWEIKTISKDHSCIPYNYEKGKRKITTEWLSEYFLEDFRLHPYMSLREAKKVMEQKVDYEISIKMCSKARRKAKSLIIGDYKGQFSLVRDYAQEILKHNPNSTVVVTTSRVTEVSPCVFSGIYICLGALKEGMIHGCRPVISIDGCFIKGPWAGQILVAVGRDGNNQMFPVAWAVTERENTATWKWFMELLVSDLKMGDGDGWTVISDQQKGLVDSIAQFLPRAEHRLCARHVYANLRKRFKGLLYRDVFWKIAKSSTDPDYSKHMQEMKDMDVGAWKFLVDKKPEHWCRAFFKVHAKTDSVDNNMAEIFNAFILEARYKPILSMLDDIFSLVMTRMATRQAQWTSYEKEFCPRILKKLDLAKEKSKYWNSLPSCNGKYQVRHGTDGYVVSLISKTCTCRSWDLNGIPCPHALAAMRKAGVTAETMLDNFYTIEMYRKTYAHAINPVNGQNMWAKSTGDPICAPEFKNSKKNLATKRRLEEGDSLGKKPTRFGMVSRVGHMKTCSKCHLEGHNKRNCNTSSNASGSQTNPTPFTHPATQPSPSSTQPCRRIPKLSTRRSQPTLNNQPLQEPPRFIDINNTKRKELQIRKG